MSDLYITAPLVNGFGQDYQMEREQRAEATEEDILSRNSFEETLADASRPSAEEALRRHDEALRKLLKEQT